MVPKGATDPMPGLIETLVASVEDQVSVEDWPTQIVLGDAVMATATKTTSALAGGIVAETGLKMPIMVNTTRLFRNDFLIFIAV